MCHAPRRTVLGVALLLLPLVAEAGKSRPEAPPLTAEHAHPQGAFTFRTPEGWTVGALPGRPDVYEATDGSLAVRFLYRNMESGYDSLHADCMLEQLAPAMETSPDVRYEYDFVSWEDRDRRMLDSAFEVRYDRPTRGSKEWRQRNLTVVGGGESLCLITYAPLSLWKKSSATRGLLEAILRSVTFKNAPAASPSPTARK